MNGLKALFEQIVGNGRLNLYLRQKVDHIFGAAVKFRVPLLTPEALNFGYGESVDAEFGERFAHFIEFEGFDDGGNKFHFFLPRLCLSGKRLLPALSITLPFSASLGGLSSA